MKELFLPELKNCLSCVLLCIALSSRVSAAADPVDATAASRSVRNPERPEPWKLENPLRPDVFYASERYPFWLNPRGAWISRDGRHVAFYSREARSTDEAQGISRTLIIKDVEKDAVVLKKSILSKEESLFRAGAFSESLARTHAWEVMKQVDEYRFQPMISAELPSAEELDASDSCYAKQVHLEYSLSLEDLKFSYKEPRLQVWRRDKKILDRLLPSWRLHQRGCELNSPSWMKRVFVDPVRGAALVELEFCGGHGCPEPASTFHALRIPTEPPHGQQQALISNAEGGRSPSLHYETAYSDTGMDYYATGFPAISKDGSLIAMAETFAETKVDGRVFRVSLRRPDSDEVVWSRAVVTAAEYSAANASRTVEKLDEQVFERMRQINEYLGQTKWIPLVEQPISPRVTDFCQRSPDQRVQLGSSQIFFQQGHLRSDRSLDSPLEWDLPDARPSEDAGTPLDAGSSGTSACGDRTRGFVDTAYADVQTGVVLLRFATCGDASCPETFAGYHALKWR